MSLIEKYFGEHSKSKHEIPKVYTEEPEQEGPRRIVVKRTGQTGITAVAHKTPHGLHKDTHAIHLLGKILCDGKSSRLYQKIVDQGLATSLFMYDFPFKDNGLFISYAFLTPNTDNQKVESIILNEYSKIANDGITENELKKAKAQISSDISFSRDGSYAIAGALNEALAIGDWKFYTNFIENINNVSAKDVQSIVKKYLVEDQSTVGWFCLLYTSPSPRDKRQSRMPSSA